MKRILITVVGGLLLVVLWQAGSALSASQPASNAIATIHAFTGRSDLVLKEVPSSESLPGVREQTFTTANGDSIFVVDDQHQEVTTAVMSVDGVQRRTTALTRDEALIAAQNFQHRARATEGLSLLAERLDDHGAAGTMYRFEWGERLGTQRALGLDRIAISVDSATGAVVSYLRVLPQGTTVNSEPTISAAMAKEIAAKAFGVPVVKDSIELDVWWQNNDRSQPQVLRWTVILEGENAKGTLPSNVSRGAFIIDAHTGLILETLR